MLRVRDAVVWTICGLLAAPPSIASGAVQQRHQLNLERTATGRRLTGKFLHITDFHPDPFYKPHSSTGGDAACHRDHGPAGAYGAENSDCDSPLLLINETFRWIQENVARDVDFVIWTGDSARHDNDERIPRTQKQVIEQNEFLVSKFTEVFGLKDKHNHPTNAFRIPIVSTFGNNDVMPHNIFSQGPNKWTTKYLDVWRSIIPEAQRHQFKQGGWFSVEVIPGKLAVISLNTLYFFNSNSGVNGCADRHEPGYEHMEWLRVQLQLLRTRGMKAILMGHVPPARVDSKENWDETCWQKYALWVRQFRDIIVGSFYGHMNIDHFILQDFEQISKEAQRGRMRTSTASHEKGKSLPERDGALSDHGQLTTASASAYLLDLRRSWAQLSGPSNKVVKKMGSALNYSGKLSFLHWLFSSIRVQNQDITADEHNKAAYLDRIGGIFAERYAVTHVAPSVVPNYYPTLRIIEYNITGLEDMYIPPPDTTSELFPSPAHESPTTNDEFCNGEGHLCMIEPTLKYSKVRKGRKHRKKNKFKVPKGPSRSAPPGPAYSPQTFTFTRFVQYYANLTEINNDSFTSQYLSDSLSTSQSPMNPHLQTTVDRNPRDAFDRRLSSNVRPEDDKCGHEKGETHQGNLFQPTTQPKDLAFVVEYDTREDEGFADLTVRRWVDFAKKIGQSEPNKILSEGDEDDIYQAESDEKHMDGAFTDDSDEQEDVFVLEEKSKKSNKLLSKSISASKAWNTFIRRAFVGTVDFHEMEALSSTSLLVRTLDRSSNNETS